MIKIIKNTFSEFNKYKKQVKHPKEKRGWDEFAKTKEGIKFELRMHILEKEQHGCCAYCGCYINNPKDNANIDHFKTRNLFPEKTLDYDNLLVSCKSLKNCSSYKDANINNDGKNRDKTYCNIINPVEDDPEEYFEYHIGGEIYAKSGKLKEKAENTIRLFNLKETDFRRKIIYRKMLELFQCTPDISLEMALSIIKCSKAFIKCVFGTIKSKVIKR